MSITARLDFNHRPGILRLESRKRTHARARLGGHDHVVAPPPQSSTQNFLGLAHGVDIGRIKEIDTIIHSHRHHTIVGRLIYPAQTPLAVAERHGAQAQGGYLQTTPAHVLGSASHRTRSPLAAPFQQKKSPAPTAGLLTLHLMRRHRVRLSIGFRNLAQGLSALAHEDIDPSQVSDG